MNCLSTSTLLLLGMLLLMTLSLPLRAADFDGWQPPSTGGRLDPTGGRDGAAAVLLEQDKETTNHPWLSPAQPVQGKYVRASAWMRVQDLFYLDFGFFAAASVEFMDAAGNPVKDEPFILSREIMLSEPLLEQRMQTHDRRLNFGWRYGERLIPVPESARQVRVRFGFSQRTHGKAWLDDPQLTFTDTPEPAPVASNAAESLPAIEVRLRTAEHARADDPLGHIFFPGEDAVFNVAAPKKGDQGPATLDVTVRDSEDYVVWRSRLDVPNNSDGLAVAMPAAIAEPFIGRMLTARFEFVAGATPIARTEFTFGYTNEWKRDQVRHGAEQRYIANLRSTWSSTKHGRYWMQHGDALTTCSLHIKNIWKDGTQPPDLSNLSAFYQRPDTFNKQFNYSVVVLITGGEPNLIPAFSHLGHHALPEPESIGAFMRAAVRRFPHVKYWKALNEMYRKDVPGYRQAFVQCQKAFYEAVKSENPDAVVIMDNSSIRDDARGLFELGVFNYCDAIDPHLYGEIEPTMFGFFKQEKEMLESWGVHKRWISLEADPIPGAGAQGIEPRWVSEELPKMLGAFFGMGGEKMCMLGSGAVADPTDPFYADAHASTNFTPMINYFAYRRFIDQVALRPTGGSHVLGDMQVRYARFDGDDDSVLVLWSREGEHTVRVRSGKPLRVVDNVRLDQQLTSENGEYDLTVGVQPVYVTGARDLSIALQPKTASARSPDGGVVVGRPSVVTLTVPDSSAMSATVTLPPGVKAKATTVPMAGGVATFEVTLPEDHAGSLATLSFTYGKSPESVQGMVLHRFELIRPISAEIWSDAALKDGRPQYVVRVTNSNPVPASGYVVARSPRTDDVRPEEARKSFNIPAKKSVDLKFDFSASREPRVADDQNSWPAVAFVYPEDASAFAVRDRVSLSNLPKVRRGLRIDGDLSDWPDWNTAGVQAIGGAQQFVAAVSGAKAGDVQAKMQVAWDRATLYFAAQVRGADASKSKGVRFIVNNAQNKLAGAYEVMADDRHYAIVSDGDGFKLEASAGSPDARGVRYVARRVEGGIDYEVAIPGWETADVLEVDPDRWLRLSAVVYDADGKGYWQWFGGGKSPRAFETFGLFQLSAYGVDEWGAKFGSPTAQGGYQREGYVGLAALPNGDRVRVKSTAPGKSTVEILKPGGELVRSFELPVGYGIHNVAVDRKGRLIVADRVAGVNFYSADTGEQIPLGPTKGFYPKRHIIEYRSQGVAQDADGNYFVTALHKRRAGPSQPSPVVVERRLAKISGITMFDEDGNEVPTFGDSLFVKDMMGPIRMFGTMGERAGAFLYAESIAVDPTARLWVTDADANTLQIFTRKSAGVYEELPMVFVDLPEGMPFAQVRMLPDGRALLYSDKAIRVAALKDGKVTFSEPTITELPIRDIKVSDGKLLMLDSKGAISERPLP